MDSEYTPVVFSVGSSFFSETSGDTTVLNWETGFLNPFTSVHGRNGLFRSSDQVSIVAFLTSLFLFSSFNLVKVFLEVAQLTSFLHDLLLHEVWWLDHIVSSLHQEMDSEIDEGVVEKNTVTFQEVTSVPGNLLASFWIVTAEGFQDFVVIESTSFVGDLDVWDFAPCLDNEIVIFVVVNGDGVMDDVSDFVDFGVDFFEELSFGDFGLFLFFFIFGFDFELLFALILFVGFLFVFDDVLIIIPLLFKGVEIEPD